MLLLFCAGALFVVVNFCAVGPGISRHKGQPVGRRGVDYFTRAEAAIAHAQRLIDARDRVAF